MANNMVKALLKCPLVRNAKAIGKMETELVGLKNIEILAQTKQVLKLKNLQVCFV